MSDRTVISDTEHFLTENSLLIALLLSNGTQCITRTVRILNILEKNDRSRLISCGKLDSSHFKDSLTEGLLETNIQNTVHQEFIFDYSE